MNMLQAAIAASTLLCSLVAGFLFAFAVVAMPGLGTLRDLDFLRAFKAIDRVIQDRQPVFMIVWVGSVVAVALALVMSLLWTEGLDRSLMILAAATYLLGVQLPTAVINVPLNNQLQETRLNHVDEASLREVRGGFEPRWTRWNAIRTVAAVITSVLLLLLLSRSSTPLL